MCWWASRLLPCPGYYKQCCNEHWGARVSFRSGFLYPSLKKRNARHAEIIVDHASIPSLEDQCSVTYLRAFAHTLCLECLFSFLSPEKCQHKPENEVKWHGLCTVPEDFPVCLSFICLSLCSGTYHLLLFSTPKKLLKGKCSILFHIASPVSSTKPGSCCCCWVAKLCLTLLNPIDCSPSVSSVHRVLQAGIMECVGIPFSMGSSWPRDWAQVSYFSCVAGHVLYH